MVNNSMVELVLILVGLLSHLAEFSFFSRFFTNFLDFIINFAFLQHSWYCYFFLSFSYFFLATSSNFFIFSRKVAISLLNPTIVAIVRECKRIGDLRLVTI